MPMTHLHVGHHDHTIGSTNYHMSFITNSKCWSIFSWN